MAPVMQIRHDPERFGEWLRGECQRVEIESHQQLHRALILQGFEEGEKTVERWFKGSNAPRDHSPVLVTLATLGSAEIYERYEDYLKEEFERFRSFHRNPAQGGSGGNKLRGRDSNSQPSVFKPKRVAA